MGLEFTDELSLVDFIKCLSEIKDRGGIWVVTNMHIGHHTYIVCLVTYVHVISEKSMRELNKLVFTGETFVETVAVEDNGMLLCDA